MGKFFALLVALVMLLQCASMAEQLEFQLEGEWYASHQYSELYDCADLDENNIFHIRKNDEVAIYYPDGVVDYYGDVGKVERVQLSESAVIYYIIQNTKLYGEMLCADLFLKTDDSWKRYSVESSVRLLVFNGQIISQKNNERVPYMLSGDDMFLIFEDKYVGGSIQAFGDTVFIYDIGEEQRVIGEGDNAIDWGTPFYLFINTSIL